MTAVGELERVGRFLAIGVLNTFIGLATIYLCKWFLETGDILSNMIGYAVGLINSFVWNRRLTFAHTGAVFPAALRFLIVFLVAYILNLGTVLAAIHGFDVNSYVAHAIAVVPYTTVYYLGSKYFAFRSAPSRND